ncbi:MAG: M23 family metallopeptidase [Treponemataceae bacterium]|nr:M23 family metallopeptidase [Treponemataceae bacterium]
MKELSSHDLMFRQFNSDLEQNYKYIAQGQALEDELVDSIFFYKYKAKEGDTFFSLAARFNIGQETLATLNHIVSPNDLLCGKTLIISNCKGLFIPENPKTSFEVLLKKKCDNSKSVVDYSINGEKFSFFTSYQIGPTERSFFLDTSLRMPLADSVLTSDYGMRISPISGKKLFHNGIDLAAPEGTEVYACGNGIVDKTGYDSVYGNYVFLKHSQTRFSFYAHLSEIDVKSGMYLSAGSMLGKIGNTGASTGPHLHFEIRDNNKSVDPFSVLSR